MSRRNDNKQNLKRLAIGSGIAAVAGYLAGVLTAPKSGKETRDDIQQAAESSRYQAEKDLKKLNDELADIIRDAKKKGLKLSSKSEKDFKSALEKSVDTKEKLRDILSAVHEGDADDQDLKRAIKNASSAIDHLKDFLKK